MIDVHRHSGRRLSPHGDQHARVAFGPWAHDSPLTNGFGGRGGLSEIQLPPAGRFTPGASDAEEIVTYVYSGGLVLEDPNGGQAVAYAGEFLRSALPHAADDREIRASTTAGAHVFRVSLCRLDAGPGQAGERARFTEAQRRNRVCAVASPDARDGSLQVHHDAVVCSSVLDSGHHFPYLLRPMRTVWVHVVNGSAMFGEHLLRSGDTVGVTGEPWVSFVAQQTSEVLLIDLGLHDAAEPRPS